MLRSLVGSEMCIRDRRLLVFIFSRLLPSGPIPFIMAEPATKRFAEVSENEIDEIIAAWTPAAILSANKGWISVFDKIINSTRSKRTPLHLASCEPLLALSSGHVINLLLPGCFGHYGMLWTSRLALGPTALWLTCRSITCHKFIMPEATRQQHNYLHLNVM